MGYLIDIINATRLVCNFLILARCVISFIPNINVYKEPIRSIVKLSDMILNPIRDFLYRLGIGGPIDISPIIAMFLIRFAYHILIDLVFLLV